MLHPLGHAIGANTAQDKGTLKEGGGPWRRLRAQGAAEINRRTLSEEAQVASPRASRLSRSFELGRYRAVTRYRAARLGAKVRLARLLYGDDPFSCTPRFSGVNFLVLCSAYYMFIDNLRLASFPAEADRSVMVVTT